MNRNNRKYSLPYNGTDPNWYISEVLKRRKHVDHVYCELPLGSMLSHVRFAFENAKDLEFERVKKRFDYLENCAEFLKLSDGKFRRICPVNAMYYPFKDVKELGSFAYDVAKCVRDYHIDGLILSDPRLAQIMRELFPDLELHTSCNCHSWLLPQMRLWRDRFDVKVFNPPREILRYPSQLKMMAEQGFKLKCLINEGCLIGCANQFNHNLGIAMRCLGTMDSCLQRGIGDVLRSNWILPRWQKYYDDYVSIYKIAGRNSVGDYPFRTMDAYLTENNSMPFSELMLSGVSLYFSKFVPESVSKSFTIDQIPDRIAFCECRNCDSCHFCDEFMKKVIPSEYHCNFVPGRFKLSF